MRAPEARKTGPTEAESPEQKCCGGVGRSAVLPRAPQVQRCPEPGQQAGETAQQGSLRTSQPTAMEGSCLSQERQGQEAEGPSFRPS